MPDITTTLQMSYIEALIESTLNDHRQILLARAYHAGVQPVYLTERQKEYLEMNSDIQFCLNLVRLVVTAVRDELNVVGFETDEKPDKEGIKLQSQWFWDLWVANRMDSRQGEQHETALRDRESFIILDWDKERKLPTLITHERYTDPDAEAWAGRWTGLSYDTLEAMKGTGQGVWVLYENDDPNQPMIAAVQQWYESVYNERGEFVVKRRRTVYYPDQIIRYEFDEADWVELETVPWVGKDGKAIGIPVVHFRNEGGRPEAWDAIPPQDVINKTWVDILGTMDLSGFPMFALFGMYPTTDGKVPAEDGSNVWSFGPAQIVGNASAKGNETSFEKIEGADPTPLMETLKDQVMFLAQVTSTPASRFIITAQIASDKTQKEQEKGLRKKAANRQVIFGEAWETTMRLARRIANAFGNADLDEDVSIDTVWKNIESVEELKDEQTLGVPQETLWGKLGYSQKQIKEMKGTTEYRLSFEKAFWDAYSSASNNGQTVEAFARRIGLSDDEIKALTEGMESDRVPPTDL